VRILVRGADIERKIAMYALMRALDLIRHRRDPATGNGKIAHALAVVTDDGAALSGLRLSCRSSIFHLLRFAPLSG